MADTNALGPADWTTAAAVAETHVSVVTFIGDRAYKLLKPVDMGFLNHTTREARLRACRWEVELNRRLAPDVYLGVLDVLDADGAPVDHLIAMRRMPGERRLSRLVDGPGGPDAVRAVARAVAAFHAGARRSPQIDAAGSRDALRGLWEQNLRQMAPFAGTVLPDAECAAVAADARTYLEGRGDLLAARAAAGLMRDGHGDLLADDIFVLDDGPRILDCLAFADHMRWGDVLLDVAFLGMDLEARGRSDLAARLLHWYREFGNEHHPASLWWHYCGYRAHVRSKVACLRHAQGDPAAAAEACRLHALAARHLARGRVRMVLVGGPVGTGKSTLATQLAERHDLVLLRTDEIRKDIAGVGHDTSMAAAPGQGPYRPERVAAVYAEAVRRAGRLMALGESVVLDASWSDAGERAAARAAAHAAGARTVELCCHAPEDVAEARVTERMRRGGAVSDADIAVARSMRRAFAPWPEAHVVDTTGAVDDARAAASAMLGGD